MNYQIEWIDATQTEHYTSEQELIAEYKELGINVIVENNDQNDFLSWSGWIDIEASHSFEADSDDEAIEYTKKYDFGGRNVDVFSLIRNNITIMTEDGKL